ncbi:DUF1524 domain-containing protein [Knoellia sp. 3-2P3]|uniref:GmrSD restriction endonuclease domain-containing protein n=1 Tax=unclassified Knoellia TaxID=2618719 RepID=UPI0023D97CEF|nr:DUF1524 domain-containing protein [Knoellia sp. 3-2P3]MDF2093357.1 DUF1524 domain-containing protein [Knoellia sp. 3-2P3]
MSSRARPPRLAWLVGCALLAAALVWPGLSGQAEPAGTVAGPPATVAPSSEEAAPSPGVPPAATPSSPPSSTPAARTEPVTTPSRPVPRAGTALAALATLPVKGRAPRTGYEREVFGQAWSDVDRNGCDTRNDILRRDLTAYTLKAGTRGCLVLRGTLDDPYTGATIAFVRGQDTSSRVQVDHVVALSDAWQKGAQQLSFARRTAFANDPLNLLAVEGTANQRKGDGDAATWLPPRRAYRCAYVARQVAVKQRYGLWVTAAERDAVSRVLSGCPGEPLPRAGQVPLGGGPEEAATAPSAPRPSPSSTAAVAPAARPAGSDPRFETCSAATSAGYGPYVSGRDPEYDWYRDRDGDGVVCE